MGRPQLHMPNILSIDSPIDLCVIQIVLVVLLSISDSNPTTRVGMIVQRHIP